MTVSLEMMQRVYSPPEPATSLGGMVMGNPAVMESVQKALLDRAEGRMKPLNEVMERFGVQ